MKKTLLAFLSSYMLFSACATDTTESSGPAPLRMGFIPSENMAEIQRNAQPLVDKLSEALNREVEPVIAADYTGVVEAFRNGKLDVAFLTPASYVMAHNEAGAKVILRAQRGDTPFYFSVIFARKDSGFKNLKDLKGKSFSFGDNLSTAGYIYPLKMLKAAGLNPETDFENHLFSGSHDATVLAVYNKKASAGATYANDSKGTDGAWMHVLKPEQAKDIQVLAVSEAIPADNICISKNLDAQTANQVQSFFEKLSTTPDGQKLIQELYRIDRFIPATDADYQGIRDAFIASGINLKQSQKAQ